MQAEERAAWLRLSLTPGVTPAIARSLLAEFGLPNALFSGRISAARLAACCGDLALAGTLLGASSPETQGGLQRAQQWLDQHDQHSLVCLADDDYPRRLLDLGDAPILLYADGNRELLSQPALAIVGSRSATRQGMQNAAAFAAHLGRAGLCIVSGLADGIDAAAHSGALDANAGTIAILGTGIDVVYPRSNRMLSARIAQKGLLLSEYPLGTAAIAHNFPRRNRLIAALAQAVLVVEAAVHSGSLITARIAAELGREVLAIPGSIHAPLARGCHRLIRDGARLVESTRDVLEELRLPLAGAVPAGPAASGAGTLMAQAGAILDALGHDPADIDTLVSRSGHDAGTIAAALLELELAQRVERLPGNRYQRLR